MGTMTIVILAISGLALLFSLISGIRKGRNHSILRLILLAGCAAGAVYLSPIVNEIIFGIDMGGVSFVQAMADMYIDGMKELPPEVLEQVIAIFEGLIGIILYLIIFYLLRFVCFILIAPILKIFVKKDLIKKRLFGFIVGILQGIVIIIAVAVPLNALTNEISQLSKVEVSGTKVLETKDEMGIIAHTETEIYEIYDKIGGWYYELMTK